MTTPQADRWEVVRICVAVGAALGVAGLAWRIVAFNNCGPDGQILPGFSLFPLGPYVGCVAVPVVWKRTAEHRIGIAAIVGFVTSVVTWFVLIRSLGGSNDDLRTVDEDAPIFVFLIVYLLVLIATLVVMHRHSSRPGHIGGFLLGFVTPLLLLGLLWWVPFCY